MATPKILVTGRSGQVASALAAGAGRRTLKCLGRPYLDLTDRESVHRQMSAIAPDIVINTAAYTAVDGAESDADAAQALNVDGPRYLAEACCDTGAALIHLSTDCVFDGALSRAYRPDDAPAPLGVYGQTKLAGEQAAQETLPQTLVVRVSWIFSEFASNFVTAMLGVARDYKTVTVVSDQQGCPTHAPDLAAALLSMADQATAPDFQAWGTYHLAGRGQTDRVSMARQIFKESARLGGPVAKVHPILTRDYGALAARPLNARLDMGKTQEVFGVSLPRWQTGLQTTVSALLSGG